MGRLNKFPGLTEKQERFCLKYTECLNASEAYRYAYDCRKMSAKSVWRKAAELMANGNVAARIEYIQSHIAETSGIAVLRIISELGRIAFSDATRIRKDWMTLKDFEVLTEDEKACIQSIETKERKCQALDGNEVIETYCKVRMYDKQKALDSLTQILGYNQPRKMQGELRLSGLRIEVQDEDTAKNLMKIVERQ